MPYLIGIEHPGKRGIALSRIAGADETSALPSFADILNASRHFASGPDTRNPLFSVVGRPNFVSNGKPNATAPRDLFVSAGNDIEGAHHDGISTFLTEQLSRLHVDHMHPRALDALDRLVGIWVGCLWRVCDHTLHYFFGDRTAKQDGLHSSTKKVPVIGGRVK